MSLLHTNNINALNAVTATVANTAATTYDCSARQLMSIQFTCSGHTSGNGAFGVEVSNDGTNWVVYNRLAPNLVGTNAQTSAAVAAPTLNTNTSAIYFFPVGDYFRLIRVFVTVTTDGVYTATLQQAG
jgi:hypothetical protein